jgi:putative aldouronate transport system permease protein
MSRGEWIYQVAAHMVVILVALACLVPFLYVVAISLTPMEELIRVGRFVLIPQHTTLGAYKMALQGGRIVQGFGVSVARVALGTLLHLVVSSAAGYALSKRHLPGSRFFMLLVLIAFLFGPGLIPYYLVVRSLGLVNTFWMMVVPGAAGAWAVFIFRQFFMELPADLEEAARVDGASDVDVLWRVVLPLSLPVYAVLGLFNVVYHWNDFLTTAIFVTNPDLHPLAFILQRTLTMVSRWSSGITPAAGNDAAVTPEAWAAIGNTQYRMSVVVLVSLPIIMLYPFLQKHFAKGMLTGTPKG